MMVAQMSPAGRELAEISIDSQRDHMENMQQAQRGLGVSTLMSERRISTTQHLEISMQGIEPCE